MEECPKCLGALTVMVGKQNKEGFEYVNCTLCEGHGVVSVVLHQDFSSATRPFEDDDEFSH